MQFSGNANSEVMRGSPYAAYYLVLLTVCASTLFAPPSIVRVIASHCGGNSRVVGSILDLLQKTLVICAVIVGVTWGERLPLSSIGLKPPATTDLIFGFVGFLSYMLLVTTIFYGFVAGPFIGLVRPPNLRGFDRITLLSLRALLSLANGVEEEILFRGYAIERLEATVHQTWIAILLAYGFCMAAHWSYWGTIAFTIIGIGQIVFLGMYLLKRSLVPCIIAHVLADLLGLLMSPAA